MYYGNYTARVSSSDTTQRSTSDASAWILGDKLQCIDFKNHVMTRLYSQYAAPQASQVVTTEQIDYVCSSTQPGSKLRSFFLDILATHLADKTRVIGTWEEWDAVFQKFPDARAFVLQSSMTMPAERRYIKWLCQYLEQKPQASSPAIANLVTDGRAKKVESGIPAKRNADGSPVQEDVADGPTMTDDETTVGSGWRRNDNAAPIPRPWTSQVWGPPPTTR